MASFAAIAVNGYLLSVVATMMHFSERLLPATHLRNEWVITFGFVGSGNRQEISVSTSVVPIVIEGVSPESEFANLLIGNLNRRR
jgi:hypothetical protein